MHAFFTRSLYITYKYAIDTDIWLQPPRQDYSEDDVTELAQWEFVEIQIGNSSDWPNGCIYLWFLFCLYLSIGAIDGGTSGVCVSCNNKIHREKTSEIDGGGRSKRKRERVGDWNEAIKRAHWKKNQTESFQNSRLTKESTENALKTVFTLFSIESMYDKSPNDKCVNISDYDYARI